MSRREFIAFLGGAVIWSVAARTQQAHKLVRIGFLASARLPPHERFFRRLQELGYVERQNLSIEYRFAEGYDDRYPTLAAELVALQVDLIVTGGTPAALAAKHATRTIPIVMGSIGEAVSTGVVTNLARPEGNITGFAALNVELEGKRLEILKELVPRLSRVGMLANAANPFFNASLKNLQHVADALGVGLDFFEIRHKDEVEGALRLLDQSRPDGVLVAADTVLLTKRREIVMALAKSNLPAIYPFREYAEVGGLIVQGANLGILFERAADYVDKILNGAKPGDLPVQQATEFELILNLKTAKALGLTIPPTVMIRTDEVIE